MQFRHSGIYEFTEHSPNSAGALFIAGQQILVSPVSERPQVVEVMLGAGVYELQYGFLHMETDGVQGVEMDLRWELKSDDVFCDWSCQIQQAGPPAAASADSCRTSADDIEWFDIANQTGECNTDGCSTPRRARQLVWPHWVLVLTLVLQVHTRAGVTLQPAVRLGWAR
jgi:hypothetical protein